MDFNVRNILHIVVSVLMWCLFGYYWYVVSGREIGPATIQALGVLAVVILLGLILTFWWVAHNKKLARRNRRSRAPETVPESFTHDYLGRTLTGQPLETLRAAQVVDVRVEGDLYDTDGNPGAKIYAAADGRGA